MRKLQDHAEMIKTSVALPRELWKLAHLRALDERRGLQDVIASALEEYLLAALKESQVTERDNLATAVDAALKGERQTGSILLRRIQTEAKKGQKNR